MIEDQIRILFLAANPKGSTPLNLDGEFEEIESQLHETRHARSFLLQHRWKLNRDHLLDFLLKYRPHVVHFSGHGSADNLILQDKEGNPWPLDRATARVVFSAARGATRMVVLNACHSRDVAEEISEIIDCVIGMAQPVHDTTAVTFAAALYRGLGEGVSVRDAFDQARSQIGLSGQRGDKVPQILTKPGLDPRRIFPLQEWIAAATTAPTRRIPSDRAGLRKMLTQVFALEADFAQFLGEHFPDVVRRFSAGMDRVTQMNIFFTLKAPEEIAPALAEYLQQESRAGVSS